MINTNRIQSAVMAVITPLTVGFSYGWKAGVVAEMAVAFILSVAEAVVNDFRDAARK